VLDPFLGSGTTSLVARKLSRNSIGYEINLDFLPIIEEKLGIRQKTLFADARFEIVTQTSPKKNFTEEIEKLPYIFRDPVKFDKKVDPRKLQFGSKINNHFATREKYYDVTRIISPVRLVLGKGLNVRLLGIKEKPEKKSQAVQFLRDKTRGQKVFIKFDVVKHDKNNNLLCYLYLQNKTFLNVHLIRKGLADVDITFDHRYKSKFLGYQKEITNE